MLSPRREIIRFAVQPQTLVSAELAEVVTESRARHPERDD
jgi:hypothetical protein